jgi:hypothetical protein
LIIKGQEDVVGLLELHLLLLLDLLFHLLLLDCWGCRRCSSNALRLVADILVALTADTPGCEAAAGGTQPIGHHHHLLLLVVWVACSSAAAGPCTADPAAAAVAAGLTEPTASQLGKGRGC